MTHHENFNQAEKGEFVTNQGFHQETPMLWTAVVFVAIVGAIAVILAVLLKLYGFGDSGSVD